MTSRLLVAMQFALMAIVVARASPANASAAGVVLLATSAFVGLWALASNRPGNFNIRPEPKEGGRLVTHGPYRWVRHPMYTLFFLQATGILLLTRNWFIGGVYILGLSLVMIARVAREERTMLEKFGDAYRAYIQTTGRFLPKF